MKTKHQLYLENLIDKALDKTSKQEKDLADKDLDNELCACGNYKMEESDFCEDCI